MKLDITKMLHNVIDADWAESDRLADNDNSVLVGAQAHQDNIMTTIIIKWSQCAQLAGWYLLRKDYQVDRQSLLKTYCQCLNLMLLWAAKRQWTHLVVLDDEGWQRIADADQTTKVQDLNKQFLAINRLLTDVQFSHSQDSYRHAWHMILKCGLVDWSFSDHAIEDESLKLSKAKN